MTLKHPFADLVGFSVTERSDKQCVTALTLEEKHLNPNGVVHGGVLYTLADTGMGGALMAALPEGHYCATIEIKIAYFRPAKEGTVRCVTELVHLGRRTASLESRLELGGKTLARAYGTFMILSHEG
jgi:acyl-CoA thioesterase